MVNEKRLIDANDFREFLKEIRQDYREEDTLSSGFAACLIETVQDEYLALAPTVDAVEVVRCKACKEWCRNSGITESPNGHCFCHDIETNGHDFCSYGERKDNANSH